MNSKTQYMRIARVERQSPKTQPVLFVYDIYRCAVRKLSQIIHRNIHQALTAFLWRPADMRRNKAILCR